AAVEQVPCDVVKPDALAQIVKLLRCFHIFPPQFRDTAARVFPVCKLREDPSRFEFFVRLRSHSNALSDNMFSEERQRQLPSGRPGMFIRASFPRFSKSCSGAIESAAADDQATSISAGAALWRSLSRHFR